MKRYCGMNHAELLEVNLAGKMPDGALIDESTAKANLFRLLPMAKRRVRR